LAFIIRIFHDAPSSECQIIKMWLTCREGTVLEYGRSAVVLTYNMVRKSCMILFQSVPQEREKNLVKPESY